MEWLAALKGLVTAKVKAAIHFTANPNTTISKTTGKNTQSISFNNKGDVNIFQFSGQVEPETIKQIKEIVLPAFDQNEILLLQQDSQKLLRDYRAFESNPETKELLDFFKDKLSGLDYRLLETGLYEAYLLENDIQKAQQIKSDIIKRYGKRGKNILNLASGGYFATHIRPLYEALSSQSEFKEDDFSTEYERIVDELPFAIFVHNGLSEEEILEELTSKAESNIKYGVNEETIILNGFGGNADRLEKLIPELQKRYKRLAPSTSYLGTLKTIQVSVYYKERS